jgi:hypothetical protein
MMKELRSLLCEINLIDSFKDFDDDGKAKSSGPGVDGGAQQRNAADLRPARLRGPRRPSRSRRRTGADSHVVTVRELAFDIERRR